jgi:hypothetical protein
VKGIYTKVEFFANLAILVVAILLGIVLVKHYLLKESGGEVANTNQPAAGTKLSLPDVDWTKSRQTLLLVLSRDCHFCSESAPFYRRLVRETAEWRDVRLMVVIPQEINEGKRYLNDLGVSIDQIRQAPLSLIGVTGTPTLILVNESGLVTAAWVGQLPPDRESEVLTKLQSDRASNSQIFEREIVDRVSMQGNRQTVPCKATS